MEPGILKRRKSFISRTSTRTGPRFSFSFRKTESGKIKLAGLRFFYLRVGNSRGISAGARLIRLDVAIGISFQTVRRWRKDFPEHEGSPRSCNQFSVVILHHFPIAFLCSPYMPDNTLFTQFVQMIFYPIRCKAGFFRQSFASYGWIGLYQSKYHFLGSFLGSLLNFRSSFPRSFLCGFHPTEKDSKG